jgi:hypothetical protein
MNKLNLIFLCPKKSNGSVFFGRLPATQRHKLAAERRKSASARQQSETLVLSLLDALRVHQELFALGAQGLWQNSATKNH